MEQGEDTQVFIKRSFRSEVHLNRRRLKQASFEADIIRN